MKIGYWVYIDNQLVTPQYAWDTNDESYQLPLPKSFDVAFPTSGTHRIRMEACVGYVQSPTPAFQFSWAPDSSPTALTPPVVDWTVPFQGTGYATGTCIPLTVKAFGLNGATIQKVDFYNGTTLLGSVTTPTGNNQYTVSWTGAK